MARHTDVARRSTGVASCDSDVYRPFVPDGRNVNLAVAVARLTAPTTVTVAVTTRAPRLAVSAVPVSVV